LNRFELESNSSIQRQAYKKFDSQQKRLAIENGLFSLANIHRQQLDSFIQSGLRITLTAPLSNLSSIRVE